MAELNVISQTKTTDSQAINLHLTTLHATRREESGTCVGVGARVFDYVNSLTIVFSIKTISSDVTLILIEFKIKSQFGTLCNESEIIIIILGKYCLIRYEDIKVEGVRIWHFMLVVILGKLI